MRFTYGAAHAIIDLMSSHSRDELETKMTGSDCVVALITFVATWLIKGLECVGVMMLPNFRITHTHYIHTSK